MSYILEALRKSERERHTGQAPSLPGVVAGATPQRPFRPILPWLVLLLALNGAVLGYFWTRHIDPAPAGAEAVAPAPPAAAQADAIQPAPPEVAPSRVAEISRAAQTPPAPVEPAAPRTRLAAAPPPGTRTSPRPKREPLVATKSGARPAAETPPSVAAKPMPEPPAVPPAAVPRPPKIPDPPAEETRPAAGEDLPFLEALPADLQQLLPPLKINLFAYSSVPAERFAIIDMKRYNPGDRITGGAALVDIRPDALVLELNGRKFLVRRP
jgi:general secretion pathway protein B